MKVSNPDVLKQPEPPTAARSSDLLGGKRETPLSLPNDTKIRFCNAFDAIKAHVILCKECDIYLRWGDGDLCSAGKAIIAQELCFADTGLETQKCVVCNNTGMVRNDQSPQGWDDCIWCKQPEASARCSNEKGQR